MDTNMDAKNETKIETKMETQIEILLILYIVKVDKMETRRTENGDQMDTFSRHN